MLSPSQNRAVLSWLLEHSSRPRKAVELWALLFEHLRRDTGEIALTRDELAAEIGVAAEHLSRLMHELAGIGAIIVHREKVAGMRGRGRAVYLMNPNVATNLAGAARDQAQAEAPTAAAGRVGPVWRRVRTRGLREESGRVPAAAAISRPAPAARARSETAVAVQAPPRAVRTPRAVSWAAISRSDFAPLPPDLLDHRQHVGRVPVRPPRRAARPASPAASRFVRLPSRTPRALAAASASRVRAEISARSFSARAA